MSNINEPNRRKDYSIVDRRACYSDFSWRIKLCLRSGSKQGYLYISFLFSNAESRDGIHN